MPGCLLPTRRRGLGRGSARKPAPEAHKIINATPINKHQLKTASAIQMTKQRSAERRSTRETNSSSSKFMAAPLLVNPVKLRMVVFILTNRCQALMC